MMTPAEDLVEFVEWVGQEEAADEASWREAREPESEERSRSRVGIAQGMVWVASGLWPVVHLRSFEAVTGRKREGWLVETTGLLIACVGAELLRSSRRGRRPSRMLGATAAASLALVDLVYGLRRRISPVYLADAVLQGGFVAGWLVSWLRDVRRRG